MSFNYDNPKQAYSATAARYLKSFHIDTQTDVDAFNVTDPADATKLYQITAVKTRYVFTQVVAQRFTDPSTYGEIHRTPPETLTGLQNTLAFSRVNLPDVMETDTPGRIYIDGTTNDGGLINNWMIQEHSVLCVAPGVWEENVTMIAFSDFIWDTSSFRKRALPTSAQITKQPS